MMLEHILCNILSFSMRHITGFLLLGTQASTSALCLGTILSNKITKKNPKLENGGTKYTVKRTRFYSLRAEIRRQSMVLFNLS